MKLVKMMGINRPVRLIEWKDIEKIVERDIKKHKKFYDRLAKM